MDSQLRVQLEVDCRDLIAVSISGCRKAAEDACLISEGVVLGQLKPQLILCSQLLHTSLKALLALSFA